MSKYYIFYSPVFQIKSKKLTGYNIQVRIRPNLENFEDWEMLTIEKDDNFEEYARLVQMLSGVYDPFDKFYFVDKHPVSILKYLRGEKEEVKKIDGWEKEIEGWSVNLRGERV